MSGCRTGLLPPAPCAASPGKRTTGRLRDGSPGCTTVGGARRTLGFETPALAFVLVGSTLCVTERPLFVTIPTHHDRFVFRLQHGVDDVILFWQGTFGIVFAQLDLSDWFSVLKTGERVSVACNDRRNFWTMAFR